ncbi:MAG: tRNA lysidine(34) synthetase TilS [bacterium]|nr:tRNA lysidine(34) synthetase TilS [bacterium]
MNDINPKDLFIDIPNLPLLAISGGADSMALLILFQESEKQFGIAHVTYGEGKWREDAYNLIHQFATQFHFPFHHFQTDVVPKKGIGFEASARLIRYEFFSKTIDTYHYSALITAHTLDDLAETVEIAIRRKQGEHAIAGIPKIGELLVRNQSVPIYRPFLDITREQLKEFLITHQIPWIEDPTNADPSYCLRNQIRSEWSKFTREEYSKQLKKMKILSEEANQLILNARNRIFAEQQKFIEESDHQKEIVQTIWLKNLTNIELIEYLHCLFRKWGYHFGMISGGQRLQFEKSLKDCRWGAQGKFGHWVNYRITSKHTVFQKTIENHRFQ